MSHVLIVEDQAPVRRLLRQWVEAEGASVIEASSAEEGLELATAAEGAAVALCDLRLPGHNGLWLADQLRTASPETTVVMATGVHEFDVAVRSLQTGVVDYVAKPFSRERLVEALRRAFAAHTARRAVAAMQRELEMGRAQVSEAFAELEVNASGSVEAILTMMESRDPRARDTARRVARLAVNLALTLNVREPDLSHIEHAGLLHDVGKLAMLNDVPFLSAAAQLAMAVRERYDGSGVPHGLRGDEIPLGARIVSAAAAFDEFVHGAKAPVGPVEAITRLSRDRAGEFDPSVIDALWILHPPTLASSAKPRQTVDSVRL